MRSNFPTFFQADFSNVHNHYDDNGKRTPAQTDAVNHTGVNEFICQNQTFRRRQSRQNTEIGVIAAVEQ